MRLSLFALVAIWCIKAFSNEYPLVHSLWINAGVDYVASSISDDIREKIPAKDITKVNSSLPVELRYSFSFTNPHIKHYLPGGYQGISVGVLNLGALQSRGPCHAFSNIGVPVLAYIFQGGPFHKFNNRLSLNYEWNFGVAAGWKPYGEENKKFNLVVGSPVNAYLHLGINLNWQIDKNSCIFGGLGVSHFSNGNTYFPNPGVNAIGLRLGYIYIINPPDGGFEPAIADTLQKRKMQYDISVWGAPRRRVYRGNEKPVLLPGRFATAGISFAPMVRLNSWWRVGGALDLQWDQSSDMKANYIEGTTTDDIKFHTPSFWRQISVGISAHGELRMPIFAVNLGCGYNIRAPLENRGSYQNLTLKAYLGENFFLNIGYQLRNFKQQSNLMLGVGASI